MDSRRLEILGGDSNIEQLQEDLWEQQNNNEQQQWTTMNNNEQQLIIERMVSLRECHTK